MSEHSEQQQIRNLIEQSWTDRREGRLSDAMQGLTECVARCKPAGLAHEWVDALGKLGHVHEDLGDREAARASYEEAVTVCRELGDARMLGHKLRHLGDIYQKMGQSKDAETCYGEALDLYRGLGVSHPGDLANTIRSVAIHKQDSGLTQDAVALWTEARSLYASIGLQEGVDECSERLAMIT